MSAILCSGHRGRLVAATLTLSLAAACGSDPGATSADGAAETGSAPTATVEEAITAGDSEASGAEESEGEAAPAENLFPDVDVVNLADGGSINLATELGGGDRPVLLWFWAPH